MLRAAREAQGLSLDPLAQLLKVPARKLEALEADRYEELPGMAFVRSLAQSMARQLGMDPKPVLEALPQAAQPPQALESLNRGLATAFREPVSRTINARPAIHWWRPAFWLPVLLVVLAVVLWFAPPLRGWLDVLPGGWGLSSDSIAAEAAEAAAEAASEVAQDLPEVLVPARAASGASASAVVDTVFSAPQEAESASGSAPAAAGMVVLRASAESWIEARDASGKSLLSRMVQQGEEVGLDGTLPIRLKVGNAAGTTVTLHGQPLDLTPYTRDNVARLELK